MQYTNKNVLKNKTINKTSRKRFIVMGTIAVIAAVGVLIAVLITTHSKPAVPAITASSNTKGEIEPAAKPSESPSSTNPQPSNTSTDSTNRTDKNNNGPAKTNTPDANAPLLEPNGNFISNHHPNLSGKPAPNQVQSVCNTTVGANCQITFTKNGVTKSLPLQTVDQGGATYWTWNVSDLLDSGSWHIQAKATLGAQVKTADDQTELVVTQ